MPKHDYDLRLKATPVQCVPNPHPQEMPTLRQALDYLEPMQCGIITTFVKVSDEAGISTVMRASIEFKDTIGRNDDEIWSLFDNTVDAKLAR